MVAERSHIHEKAKPHVTQRIKDGLAPITIDNNFSISWGSDVNLDNIDDSLPRHTVDHFAGLVGEKPLSSFIKDRILETIRNNYDYDTHIDKKPLISYEEFSDLDGISEKLINEFDSLPLPHFLLLRFPEGLKDAHTNILPPTFSINNSFGTVVPDSDFAEEFPYRDRLSFLTHDALGLAPPEEEEWPKQPYWTYQADGYIGPSYSTKLVDIFTGHIKSFCGLGISQFVFNGYPKRTSRVLPGLSPNPFEVIVFRKTNSTWKEITRHSLDDEYINLLSGIQIDSDIENIQDSNHRHKIYRSNINQIHKVFKSSSNKILLASQWLFDSLSHHNSLLSFIQTTVALEILLGGKSSSDIIGISELLSNRCAYLIATSENQRT